MRAFIIGIATLLSLSSPAAAESTRLLDVPFVPQSEALCGGAAVSMVMRYWAATDLSAEDFAALVDERAGGISVGALARAAGERGWTAHALAATADDVQAHLRQGRPIIALIEHSPGRLHYVVIVAWTGGRVVFHDPAVNPFRSMEADAFDRAWRGTRRTTVLVLPRASSDSSHARALSDRPTSARVEGREEAGALFLKKRYTQAANLAQLVVEQHPDDLESWQLLAASRYLEGDADGALDAWNRRQEPRVDLP